MLRTASLNEDINGIKKQYNIILEQENEVIDRINPIKDFEKDLEFTKNKEDKQQSYKISGGILTLHGKDKTDLELTSDEKQAFQETMTEFNDEVTELAEFDRLNVYKTYVEWGGRLYDFDIKFYFTIGENNGIYIDGEMVKADEDFIEMMNKLKSFYEKFKAKWSKIISNRKVGS
jgi:predicted heme/steroid binding protein